MTLDQIKMRHCLGLAGLLPDTITVEISMTSNANWESECSLEGSDKFRIGRRTFTTTQGRDSLGPCDTKSDDVVVVLLGGKVPYVLREAEHENAKDVKLYRLIGDW